MLMSALRTLVFAAMGFVQTGLVHTIAIVRLGTSMEDQRDGVLVSHIIVTTPLMFVYSL